MEKTGNFDKDLEGNRVKRDREGEIKMEEGKKVENDGFKVGEIRVECSKADLSGSFTSVEQDTERIKQSMFMRTSLSSGSMERKQFYNKVDHSNLVYPSKNKENHVLNDTCTSSNNLIRIPVREYPSAKPGENAKKIAEDLQKPIEIPPIQCSNYDFTFNAEETQIISLNIKEILDQLFTQPPPPKDHEMPLSVQQKEIKDQFSTHKSILYEKTKKQFITLIKSTKSELASLNSVENFMLSKFSPQVKPAETKKQNFPQLLFNYNKTDGFITKDLTFAQHLRIPNTIGSTFLVLDNNSILMACAESSELIEININSFTKTKIVDLPSAKKYSALSYINEKFALIGGSISGYNTITDSVEILNSFNKWETIAKLNWPRSHCQAIKHKTKTYVFAGYPIEIMAFVEKYNNGKWEVLKFRLKENFACFGLASFEDEIFYFGGISKDNGKLRNFLGRIDPDKDSEFVEKSFDTVFVSNCINSSSIIDGKFYYVDCIRGRVGVIPIE